MTKKEKEICLHALDNLNLVIDELKYYKQEGYIYDMTALNYAESTKSYIKKLLKIK